MDHTPPNGTLLVAAKPPRGTEFLKWTSVLCGVIIVIIALVLVLHRDHTIEQQGDVIVAQGRQIDELLAKVDDISIDRTEEQRIEDCRKLYETDSVVAEAAYDSEFGDLFSTVVGIPAGTTADVRETITVAAVASLRDANRPYQESIRLLVEYDQSDRQLPCSHPDSPEG